MNDPELSNYSYLQLEEIYREQAAGLIDGGVDLLIIETSQDILEVKATINGIHQAFADTRISLPIQAQVTLDTTGRMLLGTDIGAALTILEGMPVDVVGLNCSTGPDYMRDPIRYLGEHSSLPVSCIPNAGLPMNIDGQAVYPLEPRAYTDQMTEFIDKFHVQVVGGCCGTTPEHLKLLVDRVSGNASPNRTIYSIPALASATQAVALAQEPRPLLIGERLNTQGSQKFKKLILEDDYDSILSIARQQVDSGAHALDLCVALTERANEAETMRRLIKTLGPVVHAPLVIDTTEPDVLETALQTAPGRCLINSINFESGPAKSQKIFALALKYNAVVMALTIDEQGMAKTAARKLEIARRIYKMAVDDFGLKPSDLVFDALTFTLATGDPEFDQSALETLEGIRLIKANLPGVWTSLGVSNVSFGLPPAARAVINSVMLYHAVQAGLDMAIVNPAQITPYADLGTEERGLAEDLIFNRREDALQQLIEYFKNNNDPKAPRGENQQALLQSMSTPERIQWHILHRVKDDIEKDIDEIVLSGNGEAGGDAATRNITAVNVLNTVLLPAMKEVGDRFGSGELILPFVLQSAEVMKKAVTHLEKYLLRKEGESKGKMVLATVYGDVHDIGKNLVKTILSNNGFTVIDLGKQVPAETIITRAIEEKADAIGLSALLVTTSKQMPLIINELDRRGMKIPVLIGGAAINRRFGRRILLTENNTWYEPGVFYCKDAFEGLDTMNALMNPDHRSPLLEKIHKEAEFELGRARDGQPARSESSSPSEVKPAVAIPHAPFWGPHTVQQMPVDLVFQHLSLNELFRLSWGAKNTHGEEWEKLQKEYLQRLDDMRKQALREDWLHPQGVYGYWPAQSEGNDLILFDPGSISLSRPKELVRFNFPRQVGIENLCLADYFASVTSGKMDVVAFQIVTVGQEASNRFERLQGAGNYSEAYFTHGLSVQMAEATADYLHVHIRRELGLPEEQGKRYSWGYPAIPDLEDHRKVFDLLPAEKELGMALTSAFQLVPEQSTAAIILHHPEAKYFNTGENRLEQLIKG